MGDNPEEESNIVQPDPGTETPAGSADTAEAEETLEDLKDETTALASSVGDTAAGSSSAAEFKAQAESTTSEVKENIKDIKGSPIFKQIMEVFGLYKQLLALFSGQNVDIDNIFGGDNSTQTATQIQYQDNAPIQSEGLDLQIPGREFISHEPYHRKSDELKPGTEEYLRNHFSNVIQYKDADGTAKVIRFSVGGMPGRTIISEGNKEGLGATQIKNYIERAEAPVSWYAIQSPDKIKDFFTEAGLDPEKYVIPTQARTHISSNPNNDIHAEEAIMKSAAQDALSGKNVKLTCMFGSHRSEKLAVGMILFTGLAKSLGQAIDMTGFIVGKFKGKRCQMLAHLLEICGKLGIAVERKYLAILQGEPPRAPGVPDKMEDWIDDVPKKSAPPKEWEAWYREHPQKQTMPRDWPGWLTAAPINSGDTNAWTHWYDSHPRYSEHPEDWQGFDHWWNGLPVKPVIV